MFLYQSKHVIYVIVSPPNIKAPCFTDEAEDGSTVALEK